MKRMRQALVVSLLLALGGEATACQLTMPAPLAAVDETMFVLTGTVREVVSVANASDVRGEAFGLRVEVGENLHSPAPLAGVVDVFEFNLGAGCEAIGMGRAELERRFLPGTGVRVVARAARRLPAAAVGAPARLEAGPYNPYPVLAPVYPEDPLSASLAGIYDFATPIDVDRYERIDAARFDWFWYDGLVGFEAIKEVLRLGRARDDAERVAILRRIRHLPSARFLVDFDGLVRRYVDDPAVGAALRRE